MSTTAQHPWPATGREKLLYYFLYALASVLIRLPLSWRLKLGDLFGDFFYYKAGYRQQVVLENLQRAFPEMSEEARQQMSRRHFRHLGRTIVEYLWAPAMNKAYIDKHCVVHGLEHYEEARANGQGALILASHMGGIDMGIVISAELGYPMALIGKRTRIQWVTRMLFGIREIHGVRALPEEKVAMEVFRCLKRKEFVIFVQDQFMGPPQGVKTTFFGHVTGTTPGLAVFAEKTRVPILSAWTYRDDEGRLHLVISKVPYTPGLSPQEQTQLFNDEIERTVRLYPEQWFWVHQRWKKFNG